MESYPTTYTVLHDVELRFREFTTSPGGQTSDLVDGVLAIATEIKTLSSDATLANDQLASIRVHVVAFDSATLALGMAKPREYSAALKRYREALLDLAAVVCYYLGLLEKIHSTGRYLVKKIEKLEEDAKAKLTEKDREKNGRDSTSNSRT